MASERGGSESAENREEGRGEEEGAELRVRSAAGVGREEENKLARR